MNIVKTTKSQIEIKEQLKSVAEAIKSTLGLSNEEIQELIKQNKLLDAYIVASDAMAIGCLKALNEKDL